MSLSARTKAKISNSENWGMGFLLVFFSEDNNNTAIVDKHKLFSSTPSSSSSSKSPLRKSNYSLIYSKAQFTISICALLVFITFLLFTLSTFEPAIDRSQSPSNRRILSENNNPNPKFKPNSASISTSWFSNLWKNKSDFKLKSSAKYPFALHGMGILYRRGTKAMNDLVVGHVNEDVSVDVLRLFLRVLHRSGLTAKSDLVLIFPSKSSSMEFGSVIEEENESFLKLVTRSIELNETSLNSGSKTVASFDVNQFVKRDKKEQPEPLWGKRNQSNFREEDEGKLTRLSYGSVASFDVTELDPENSLSGFLDHVPMKLRKWACYPMLLGRVRRNFKHVMLVDVKSLVLFGDPLSRVRNRSPESVYLSKKPETQSGTNKRDKSKSLTHSHGVNSAIVMGGARGVRRMSSAMLIEIVRATMQRKKKSSVSESGILSQLVTNQFMNKNVDLVTELTLVEVSSLVGLGSNSNYSHKHSVMQRGNSNTNSDVNKLIRMQICLTEVDSSVYSDC